LLGQTAQAYDETRGTNRGAARFPSLATIFAGRQRGIGQKRIVDMKRLTLFAALVFSVFALLAVLTGSPAVAQGALANGQSQSTAEGVLSAPTPAPTQAPTTGVFCIAEMTATFCNVCHRAQHEWLWDKERFRIEQRRWIEWRRREHVVDPALPGATAIQRIVQLSQTNRGSSITGVPSCAAGLRTYLASNKTKPPEHHCHVHPPR
jgi:hypothetical protein